jgi:hypothetical protein
MVFFISCWIGFSIARQKPLWTDEISTEVRDIRPSGYWHIITGNSNEGTKAPIVYCIQKFIDQIFSYKLPENANNLYFDRKAQLVCRISSIIWMSMSIALIFYYFTRTTALWAGVSALLITLSTFMVWGYWAEERSYSFWFFCTSAQSLIVLWASWHTHKKSVVLGWLMLMNVLLSLTATLSTIQIIAVSIWMFFTGYRKITDYILTTVIPVAICFFYYTQTPHFLYTILPVWKLITANIPLERIVLLFAAGLYLWRRSLQPLSVQDHKSDLKFLSYLGLIFSAAVGLLMAFKMRETGNPLDPCRLILHGRHFIFLAPIGIIASTFVFTRLMQVNSSRKIRVALVLLLVILTVPRIWKYTHFSWVTGGPTYSGSLLK